MYCRYSTWCKEYTVKCATLEEVHKCSCCIQDKCIYCLVMFIRVSSCLSDISNVVWSTRSAHVSSAYLLVCGRTPSGDECGGRSLQKWMSAKRSEALWSLLHQTSLRGGRKWPEHGQQLSYRTGGNGSHCTLVQISYIHTTATTWSKNMWWLHHLSLTNCDPQRTQNDHHMTVTWPSHDQAMSNSHWSNKNYYRGLHHSILPHHLCSAPDTHGTTILLKWC